MATRKLINVKNLFSSLLIVLFDEYPFLKLISLFTFHKRTAMNSQEIINETDFD